jgi:putative PIN family toxin of toxin-antitoxin system
VRLVLDTNVLVGALITKGTPPDQLYEAWRNDRFELVTSTAQIAELRRVLRYDRLARFVDADEALVMLSNIDSSATIVSALPSVRISPDPADNLILATALAGKADLIVSRDKQHMLILGHVEGIPIVPPREALEELWK